jgi:MFS family permease
MQPTASAQRLPNKWMVLFILMGVAVFNYGDRYLLSGLVEPIKAEFKVSDGYMGLLMGPAFALLYTLLAIPIARYADRASRIKIICAGCAVWSLFTYLSAHATGPVTLAMARVGVGIGEAAFQAPAYSLLAAYFLPNQRARAFAVMTLAVYFGQYLGYRVGPEIAAVADWRAAFEVMGLAGLVLAGIALLVVREPQRSSESINAAHLPLLPLFRTLWATLSFRFMALGMAFGTLSGVSFGMWGPALFARAYDLPITEANATFALAFGLPGLLGTLLFGVVADRLGRRGQHWLLILAASALLAATSLILMVTWAPSIGFAQALAVPSGLLGGGWSVGIMAALQYLMPDRVRATGTALGLLLISMIGNVFGPLLAGSISTLVAGDPAFSLRIGLSFIIPTGILGAGLMALAARTLVADRGKLAAATAFTRVD